MLDCGDARSHSWWRNRRESAAAIALRRVGVESLVLEQTPAIREIGAGLSLWSNAVVALRELGVDQKVIASGSAFETFLSQSSSGRAIAESNFADLAREAGAPCVCIHRAVLQRILFEEVDPASVRTGARCVRFENSTAILETGERIEADFLVGADGINSVIRRQLHGEEPARYEAPTRWRGNCNASELLPARTSLLVLGREHSLARFRVVRDWLYWFLAKNAPRGTVQTRADALATCCNWARPVLDFIHATPEEAILQNDIVDRQPLKSWGRRCHSAWRCRACIHSQPRPGRMSGN